MNLRTVIETEKISSKVKRSQFISYIRNSNSIQDFRSWLSQVKKDHYDCSHACWAYRIYQNSNINMHCSDAGEPLGTAGRPILNILEKNHLIQVGIIVIRYFGGTKLGKRGLIDEYTNSAKNVVSISTMISWNKTYIYRLESPIRHIGTLSKKIKEMSGKILKDESTNNLIWIIEMNSSLANKMINAIQSCTMGEASIERIENKKLD